jgi:dGTPase
MAGLYSDGDHSRIVDEPSDTDEPYRTAWRRDYARLIHSPCFRRLQGKTQVFPGHESDFYRNRLTHSLEVAQIAKAIAVRVNATVPAFRRRASKINPDIVEIAGLAHDLGHPPFGHNGEEALDECMRNHGGFEGNAQSLRIVSRLEKKVTLRPDEDDFTPFDEDGNDLRCGLNLTYRTMASLLKYDVMIPERASDREDPNSVMKGYYAEDESLVSEIKRNVLGVDDFEESFKTIECSIMDIADDIAYSTYDLEDNFKAGFLTPMRLFSLDDEVYAEVAKTIKKRSDKQYPDITEKYEIDPEFVRMVLFVVFESLLFGVGDELKSMFRSKELNLQAKKMMVAAEVQALSRRLASDGYHRTKFTSSAIKEFLEGLEYKRDKKFPQLSKVRLSYETFIIVEVLKNITYYAIIRSPGLQVVEYRGKDIVKSIFKALEEKDGFRLLPEDFRTLCKNSSEMVKMRTICDFIAGMTDRYALEFYSRLYGSNNLTIHKPL